MAKIDLHRETFLKGFLGFVSNDPTQKYISDQMLNYTKVMLASEGARVQTHTVMLLDYYELEGLYVNEYGDSESPKFLDAKPSLLEQLRNGVLEENPDFVAWRASKIKKGHELLEQVFQQLNMSVIRQGSELEAAFGFPWVDTVTEKTGVVTLAMTQAQRHFRSVAVYAVGTPVTIDRFMKECNDIGLLHPRIIPV